MDCVIIILIICYVKCQDFIIIMRYCTSSRDENPPVHLCRIECPVRYPDEADLLVGRRGLVADAAVLQQGVERLQVGLSSILSQLTRILLVESRVVNLSQLSQPLLPTLTFRAIFSLSSANPTSSRMTTETYLSRSRSRWSVWH